MKDALGKLLSGKRPHLLVGCDRLPEPTLLLPGSFNPLHAGHEGLLRAAEKMTGRTGLLELSVTNVDKPPLAPVEVERRLQQMTGICSVVLTCAPTFAEKAEHFPGAWFVLGYDTAIRLLNPNYHPDIPAMLTRFQALETRFMVAGRLHNGEFQTLENIEIPAGFESLFIPIPRTDFRADISSTEIRTVQE